MNSKTRVIESIYNKKNIVRVCAYCRVSTKMENQINSYEFQKQYYKDFITKKKNYIFIDIYADYSKSGTKEYGRTDFERMINDCKKGKIDIIYTKSISRFARNTLDCINIIRMI